MEKFTKLGLSKELTDVLKRFGFKAPSEIQEKAIPVLLAGKDVIGGSATGSGKTLAFASAIIENLKPKNGVQALILVPTRELAEQVATSIRNFGQNKNLNVLALYGGIRIEPQIKKIFTADIIVGTPGRILDHLNRKTLRLNKIKFLVLDEVDRMLDMGFSRDVEKIISECPKERQTMMFSATISQDIDYLYKKYTHNPINISVESYVDPSKLKQVYYDVPDYQKFSLLVSLLKKENAHSVMVFCNTRRNVDFITKNLLKVKIDARAIHGGIEQNKRIRVLADFHKNGAGILVCTDVAARGLDIKEVSHVYNYEVPAEAKDYIHRIGRTARAGKEGKAVTVLASRDYENFRNLLGSGKVEIEPQELPPIKNIEIKMDIPRRTYGSRGGSKRDVSRGRGFDANPRRTSSRGSRDRNPRGRSEGSRGSRNSSGPRRGGSRYSGRSNSSQRNSNSRSFGSRRR